MKTINEFASEREFYLTRAQARYAARRGGKVEDLGRMANGSYGLYSPCGKNIVRVWAVKQKED